MKTMMTMIAVLTLTTVAAEAQSMTGQAKGSEGVSHRRTSNTCRLPLTITYPGLTCRTSFTVPGNICYYPQRINGYTCGVYSQCVKTVGSRYVCRGWR